MDQIQKEVTLKMKAIDVDKVLIALSKLPYEVVFELIPDLHKQALEQL